MENSSQNIPKKSVDIRITFYSVEPLPCGRIQPCSRDRGSRHVRDPEDPSRLRHEREPPVRRQLRRTDCFVSWNQSQCSCSIGAKRKRKHQPRRRTGSDRLGSAGGQSSTSCSDIHRRFQAASGQFLLFLCHNFRLDAAPTAAGGTAEKQTAKYNTSGSD